jgi:DNA-binding NarL/FixJ family response regulator
MPFVLALQANEGVQRLSSGQLYLETHPEGVYLVHAATSDRACLLSPVEAEPEDPPLRALAVLSGRERQVLDLLGEGVDMHGIAAQLGLSVKSIETYRTRIKQKLGIKNRTRLLTLAVQSALAKRQRPTDGAVP